MALYYMVQFYVLYFVLLNIGFNIYDEYVFNEGRLHHYIIDSGEDTVMFDVKYVLDIFPYYGSDIGAAWRSGVDCAGALIGPGVHASHGMERTHLDAIEQTMKLLLLYLTSK